MSKADRLVDITLGTSAGAAIASVAASLVAGVGTSIAAGIVGASVGLGAGALATKKELENAVSEVVDTVKVETVIEPGKTGRISLGGVYWYARMPNDISSSVRIEPGDKVSILGRQGTTFVVIPIDENHLIATENS